MQNLVITTSDRIQHIPNSYFRDLVSEFYKHSQASSLNVKIVNIDKANLIVELSENKPDFILFTRGYGFSPNVEGVCEKNKIVKILQIDDIHYKSQSQKESRHRLFKGADIILVSYYENFLKIKEYSRYAKKVCNFPFYAPSACSAGGGAKKDRIILSGRSSKAYSFRRKLRSYAGANNFIDIIDHPGYFELNHDLIGDKYYNLLSEYKYSITASADSPLDYPVLKFFELPAIGSFCFFEDIPSLRGLGFIDEKHFISINQENYEKKISDYKNYYDKKIISNALLLINRKHRSVNRFFQLKRIIEDQRVVHWDEA
jgi:hypothetical protein